MSKIEPLYVNDEKYYISFSFDIDDFIGDGIWWLQIYDNQQNKIYDKPFAASMSKLDLQQVKKIVRNERLSQKGILL